MVQVEYNFRHVTTKTDCFWDGMVGEAYGQIRTEPLLKMRLTPVDIPTLDLCLILDQVLGGGT